MNDRYKLLHGDCLDELKQLEDNSIDSIVTDPPYGLSFMGKKWDYDVPSQDIWKECMRVLKPGGHLLAFAGSRTYHRMAVRIEDAGFDIRDQIMWIYGSGFPKSHNIGKKVEEYEGWGTALKPAHEPIVMARKPIKGSVAENVLEWGTGGINIDGCRVGNEPIQVNVDYKDEKQSDMGWGTKKAITEIKEQGRFPANVIFDEEAGKILDEQSGGASRFFYCPKANKKDRNEGCDALSDKQRPGQTDKGNYSSSVYCKDCGKTHNGTNDHSNCGDEVEYRPSTTTTKNFHPTVKPTDLMAYLIRLITPNGGVVLDPFMGSGSTGKACMREGFDFVGIEREEEYVQIAEQRIEWEYNKRKFF